MTCNVSAALAEASARMRSKVTVLSVSTHILYSIYEAAYTRNQQLQNYKCKLKGDFPETIIYWVREI